MSALTLRERETLKIRILDIIESVNNHKELPQPEKQSTPKAVATDIKWTVKKAQWGLKNLLDELLGEGWEEMGESELLRLAEVCSIQWKETKDVESKRIAGVIWELTGNVKKIEQLNYVIPWWYGSNKSD